MWLVRIPDDGPIGSWQIDDNEIVWQMVGPRPSIETRQRESKMWRYNGDARPGKGGWSAIASTESAAYLLAANAKA
jgi:hypothetical protein